MGKTELARQYVAQNIGNYAHPFWINASSQFDIGGRFIEIAEELNLQTKDDEGKLLSMEIIKEQI